MEDGVVVAVVVVVVDVAGAVSGHDNSICGVLLSLGLDWG